MKIQSPPDATPLDDETLQGLIPSLTTQRELDEFEAAGIAKATLWAQNSRALRQDLLTATGLCLLHRRMFEEVWQWAGIFRQRETNIGVAPEKIQNELGQLFGDVRYWLDHKTFLLEEIAARFHHRLVWIHPFPNGNGRFSRLATDLLMLHQRAETFTWGQAHLGYVGEKRSHYIAALKVADQRQSYAELLYFMQS